MSYNLAGGIDDETVVGEVSVKERVEQVMMRVKRGYWDLEGRGMARVQWVRGNMAKMRKRIAGRRVGGGGSKLESGVDGSIMDPERAVGGGEK